MIAPGGTSPEEALDRVLEGIRSRLANDPEDERVIAAEELRGLARHRLTAHLDTAATRATSHYAPRPGV